MICYVNCPLINMSRTCHKTESQITNLTECLHWRAKKALEVILKLILPTQWRVLGAEKYKKWRGKKTFQFLMPLFVLLKSFNGMLKLMAMVMKIVVKIEGRNFLLHSTFVGNVIHCFNRSEEHTSELQSRN